MKQTKNIISGIDLGSSTICTAVAEITTTGKINILGVGSSISAGFEKGKITDIEELQRCIERSFKRAEQIAGVHSKIAVCNIPLEGVRFLQTDGLLTSKEETGQISEQDKLECLKRSRNVVKKASEKIIHTVPIGFKVDNQPIINPVGVFARTLEVNTHLILGCSDNITKLKQVFRQSGLNLTGIAYDSLAQAAALTNDENRKNGFILIDCGGRFTRVSIFKNQSLIKTTFVPFGGDTITADLAYILKVTKPEAERIKVMFGRLEEPKNSKAIEISTIEEGRKEIEPDLVRQIIKARVAEIFTLLLKDVTTKDYQGLPLLLCGGGSLLKGLNTFLKQKLDTTFLENSTQKIEYTTAIGLTIHAVNNKLVPTVIPQKTNFWQGFGKKLLGLVS